MTSCWVTASIAATASGVGGRGGAHRLDRVGGYDAGGGVRLQHERLDPAPQLVLVRLAPDPAHLRQGCTARSRGHPRLPVARCRALPRRHSVVTAACSNVSLNRASSTRSARSWTARICTASTAAFVEWSRPTQATGTPADIDVIASSASRPLTPPPRSGTPMTGIVTCAAIVAASDGVAPPPATTTWMPRGSSSAHQSVRVRGERWALMTASSYGTPNRPRIDPTRAIDVALGQRAVDDGDPRGLGHVSSSFPAGAPTSWRRPAGRSRRAPRPRRCRAGSARRPS